MDQLVVYEGSVLGSRRGVCIESLFPLAVRRQRLAQLQLTSTDTVHAYPLKDFAVDIVGVSNRLIIRS